MKREDIMVRAGDDEISFHSLHGYKPGGHQERLLGINVKFLDGDGFHWTEGRKMMFANNIHNLLAKIQGLD